MVQLGPIISVLEEEVKQELRKGIVIWLDKDAHYKGYVDELVKRYERGEFPFPVVPFRGSYLEMLLALEPYGNGEYPDRLLIHMPGHTEESIRKSPILELYHAGARYRRALDTLIREAATGRMSPDQIDSYLSNNVSNIAAAEQWLEEALAQPQDDLTHYLDSLNLEWVLDGLLGSEPSLKNKFAQESSLPILAEYLYRHTGMDQAFLDFYLRSKIYTFIELGEAFAAWLMCVEYVQDLIRMPYLDELKPLKSLSLPLKKTCEQLINHLRQRHADLYATTAALVEAHLETKELNKISPEDLGKIDTFQKEETVVLVAALQALHTRKWEKALQWAQARLETTSFWLSRDQKRKWEWILIRDAANLGTTIEQVGRILKAPQTLREALDAYTQEGYKVDRAHRHFEQQRASLLESTLDKFVELREIAEQLQQYYRIWADEMARDFSHLCEREGFLPEADIQQRTLYDQVVHPLTQGDAKVAYFLIDAFRYEMATEFLADVQGVGTNGVLKARYAELPTITAVGMNVLAPVSKSGRLMLAGKNGFKGFKTGEYTVRQPDERVRAIGERSVDKTSSARRRVQLLNLVDVCEHSPETLKRSCSNADLIVVHSKEIDDAGEANVGLVAFGHWIQQIKSAWNRLRSIGVQEFVFTADHGFLLQDQSSKQMTWGKRGDQQRRYVMTDEPRSEDGKVTVSLSALNYDGQKGYLLFPKDTAVFSTGNPGATFVHGGNSLQERVIPVLTVSHRHPSNLKIVKYRIEAEAKPEMLKFSRIQVRVKPAPVAQGVLSFTDSKMINLGLRVPERSDIQVNIKDAPGAVVNNQQLQVGIDQDWLEVLFDLTGPHDEKVRVEVYHPDATEDVESAIPDAYFSVAGAQSIKESPIPPTSTNDWQDSFENDKVRTVFIHLQQHGSITETELTQLLGGARKVRSFSLAFEEHLKKVPFSVRIEATASGKRYVKEN
jgi:hypothetical protein